MKMQLRRVSLVFQLLAAVALLGLVASAHGQSVTYKQKALYAFKGGIIDGGNPWGGLVRDSAGNLYGTTRLGGINGCVLLPGCGAIFKIDPSGKETVLYFFTGGTDGGTPLGGLVRDEAGNLYGTTSEGGNAQQSCGTVYKLDTSNHLTVLYTFPSCFAFADDGPQSGLVRDGKGNLYGTTYTDGTAFLGTIYKIDTNGTFTILHTFDSWEGNSPYLTPLTLGPDGNLYGVTPIGGTNSAGAVYKITPTGKYTVLYSFTGADGWFPSGNVTIDKSGDVFGTTYYGGSGAGVAFEVEKSGPFSLLHAFPSGFGGSYGGGLIQDDAGNLYGTTSWDGSNAEGSVFMIDANKKFHNLYSFKGGRDGAGPFAPVIRDASGNLYGTTSSGGEWGWGVVFELSPN
jgi:uncharacterized repeat protein (TIGR03803 family)